MISLKDIGWTTSSNLDSRWRVACIQQTLLHWVTWHLISCQSTVLLTTICLPQSPLSSIHTFQASPYPHTRGTTISALISAKTPMARWAGETSHGFRTINVQCTVETLELLPFQNRQQRGIKRRFLFKSVLLKKCSLVIDFDNLNTTSFRKRKGIIRYSTMQKMTIPATKTAKKQLNS